jgi:hypothetical protein
LLKGMQSKSEDVRLVSLEAVARPVLVANAGRTWDLLLRMLDDNNALIRRQAALRLTWFEPRQSRSCIPRLQTLAEADPDAEVRRTASAAILSIEYALSLKRPGSQ